jgi:hypothetical protein
VIKNPIDFQKTFGGASASGNGNGDRSQLPKANLWLNIGYLVAIAVTNETGETVEEQRFVSLPVGIPLDTTEPVSTQSRNQGYAQFMAARNNLLTELQQIGAQLKPGEERIVGGTENGLCIQVRRVSDPASEPAVDETNPFVKTVVLPG